MSVTIILTAVLFPHMCKLAASHVIEMLELRTLQRVNQTDPWGLFDTNSNTKSTMYHVLSATLISARSTSQLFDL